MFKIGQNINCIAKKLEEYFKDYHEITCEVIMHKDNEEMNFYDIPKISVREFLKQMQEQRKKF